jgi:uncharacterized protein
MTEICSGYAHCLPDGELKNILPKLWDMASQKGFVLDARLRIAYTHCAAHTNFSYVIDPFGDVYKCVNEVGLKDYKVGSISKDGFFSDITSTYYRWLCRDPLSFKECQNCKLLPICGGGCAAYAFRKYGTYDKGYCEHLDKNSINDQIMFYLKQKYPERFENE